MTSQRNEGEEEKKEDIFKNDSRKQCCHWDNRALSGRAVVVFFSVRKEPFPLKSAVHSVRDMAENVPKQNESSVDTSAVLSDSLLPSGERASDAASSSSVDPACASSASDSPIVNTVDATIREYGRAFLERKKTDPTIKSVFALHKTDLFMDFGTKTLVAKQGRLLCDSFFFPGTLSPEILKLLLFRGQNSADLHSRCHVAHLHATNVPHQRSVRQRKATILLSMHRFHRLIG